MQKKETMKKICLLLLSLIVISGVKAEEYGQPLTVDEVIQAPGKTASEIYTSVKVWFANAMRSAQHVIQYDDAATAHIIGKVSVPFEVGGMTWYMLSGHIDFTIDVQARDGRFRVRMYDFMHEANPNKYGDAWDEGRVYINGPSAEVRPRHQRQNSEMQKRAADLLLPIIDTMLNTLEAAANGASANPADDDW